jgi:capsular exopolysaccharide synthesis family protein
LEDQPSGRDFGGQIRDLTRVLREQWWIILLCVAATTFAAAAYTSTQKKEYEATAKLLLQTDNLSATIAGAGLSGTDPTRQAATDAQLVALPAVARRVTAQLKQPLSATAVTTAAGPDSNIITVTVTDTNPGRAALFANAFARQYIGFRRDTSRQRYQRALNTVNTRLAQTRPATPDAIALRAQAKQLKLLVGLQTGDAQVVQDASPPTAAVSPNPTRNVVLGAIVGLLLGLGLAFLRDRLDRRLKSEDDLDALLPGVPIVGLVPEPRRGHASRMMTAEGYHTLQANLRLLSIEKPLNTLLVTSAAPAEGKSTVALNLALAMIEKGQTALVMDADLRRPSLSERVKADRSVGVSSLLAGEGTLATAVQERTVEPSRNGDGPSVALGGEVTIVPAGPPASNVQIVLNDRSLKALLESTRERSETVIFDGPPVGSFADMLPLAKEVDGVILVVRLYFSRKDQLKRFAAQLSNAGIAPVGVVVLGASTGPSRYYAGYLAKR